MVKQVGSFYNFISLKNEKILVPNYEASIFNFTEICIQKACETVIWLYRSIDFLTSKQ